MRRSSRAAAAAAAASQQIGERRPRRGKRLQQIQQVGVGWFGAVVAIRQCAQRGGVLRMHRAHRQQVECAIQRAGDVELAYVRRTFDASSR